MANERPYPNVTKRRDLFLKASSSDDVLAASETFT